MEPRRPLIDQSQAGLTLHERWILDFFWKAASFCSAPYFFDPFWCTIVHPMSAMQPAVKHAAIALGASYLRCQYYCVGNEKAGKMEPFILKQSSMSLSYLLEQQATPGRSVTSDCARREVALATCTIMAMLAFFCNDAAAAGKHAHHGLEIIKEWKNSGFDSSGPVGPALHESLAHLLLKYQTFSDPALVLSEDNPMLRHAPDLESFTPTTARRSLNLFWEYWSWGISRPTADGFIMGTIDDSYSPLRMTELPVLYKALTYDRQLSEYVKRAGNSVSPYARDMSLLLRLWRQVMFIVAGAQVAAREDPISSPFQVRYDGLGVYFRSVTQSAEELLQSVSRRKVSKPPFPIDLAVITPLFFCGLRCRDWTIRRDALCLLEAWGQFNDPSSRAAIVHGMKLSALRRLIDIESEGLLPGSVVPGHARIHYMHVEIPPSSSRVHISYLQSGSPSIISIDTTRFPT